MGYMDISIVGSDMAADLHYGACELLIKYYLEELEEDNHGSYNTPPSINVALSFLTVGKDFWIEHVDELAESNLIYLLIDKLNEDIDLIKAWHKEEGSSNSKYHLETFKKHLLKVQRLKNYLGIEIEDDD